MKKYLVLLLSLAIIFPLPSSGAGFPFSFFAPKTPVCNGLIQATGGTKTTDGDYDVFTLAPSDTSFTITSGCGPIEILLLGGGGTGGHAIGGGGAGAKPVYRTALWVYPGTFPVVVGTGGPQTVNTTTGGSNGNNSTFLGLTSYGGGKGGNSAYGFANGGSAGNGGGPGIQENAPGVRAIPGLSLYGGYKGGQNTTVSGIEGGGGAGCGGDGQDGVAGTAGSGGPGLQFDIKVRGSFVYYCWGAGAGGTQFFSRNPGLGGTGKFSGCSDGGYGAGGSAGCDGYGAGGAGGGYNGGSVDAGYYGGKGGDGTLIIRVKAR